MTAPTPTLQPDAPKTREDVTAHIRNAAQTTGVPFNFLLAQANQESRLNPEAKSHRSSAMGLFQFTQNTWLDMVRKHGAEHGLERLAKAIGTGRDGKPFVEDKAVRREILELRRDPEISALMAAEYAKENERVLESRLGRQVSAHDLYLAHFLGASGAARVLQGVEETPKHAAEGALPGAAKANPEVFRENGTSEPRSFASLYETVQARYDKAMRNVASLAKRTRTDIDLAVLRPSPRPDTAPAQPPAQIAQVAPSQFANAIEPATPFFPVALPPAPAGAGVRASGPVLRLMIQAMEDGKA